MLHIYYILLILLILDSFVRIFVLIICYLQQYASLRTHTVLFIFFILLCINTKFVVDIHLHSGGYRTKTIIILKHVLITIQ